MKKEERLARRTKKSRSQLFKRGAAGNVARHAPDEVTEAMNRICVGLGISKDRFVSAAGRRALERSEW
jgi:hypothetical protein